MIVLEAISPSDIESSLDAMSIKAFQRPNQENIYGYEEDQTETTLFDDDLYQAQDEDFPDFFDEGGIGITLQYQPELEATDSTDVPVRKRQENSQPNSKQDSQMSEFIPDRSNSLSQESGSAVPALSGDKKSPNSLNFIGN